MKEINMACVYIFRHGKENKFKIGRTKKSAKVRLKELQTGNPDLTFYDEIETEHDKAVETYIHRRLATKKIINGSSSDEFFAVPVAELQPIIAEANDYNREYLPVIEQAKDLGTEKPDGSIKEPGNAALAMHRELLEKEEVMARLESRVEYLKAEIKIDMGTASELRGIATWETVESTRFNEAAFKAEHPDLYEKYHTKTSISRVFRLEK
jgi:predicted phage-related endonuclease